MIYLCRNCGSFSGLTNLHISSTIHPSPKDTNNQNYITKHKTHDQQTQTEHKTRYQQ